MNSTNKLKPIIVTSLVIIIITFSLNIVLASVNDGACRNFNSVKHACGQPIDSTKGYGAVELCGDCYPCGEDDGICPMDFGANCSQCVDPDCTIILRGYTFRPNNQLLNDVHLRTIITTYNDEDQKRTISGLGGPGEYQFDDIPCGNYYLNVKHNDYPEQQVLFQCDYTKQINILNITLKTQECVQDCTRWYPPEPGLIGEGESICSADCSGVNGCAPENELVLQRCAEERKEAGQTVILETHPTYRVMGICCDGTTFNQNIIKGIGGFKSEVTNIIQSDIPVSVISNTGSVIDQVKVHILTYSKE